MKTKNDKQAITVKTVFLSIAIFFSIGIFAQNSIENYDIKNLSINLIKSSDDIVSAYKNSVATHFLLEDQINLEEWMINLEAFEESTGSSSREVSEAYISEAYINDVFTEEELILEDWMINPKWDSNDGDYFYEETLQLEKWMCCPREWGIKTSYTASL